MKRHVYLIALLYLGFAVSGSLHGIGEKTIRVRGNSIWEMMNYRTGISEIPLLRPVPVLALSSSGLSGAALDLALSFDEGKASLFKDSIGHYRVITSPSLAVVDKHYARAGFGAAHFQGELPVRGDPAGGPLVLEAQTSSALFTSNNPIYDFSIEFWLHPFNLENGEEILRWTAISNQTSQRILCVSGKNRLQWSFVNFFYAPDGAGSITININGSSAVVPKTWSHHLIRFDSLNGMIEYLIDGKVEAIEYATSTKREGGEIYTPIAGSGGRFILGESFSGLMDEFRIHGTHVANPAVRKYSPRGGRIETRAIDLGEGSNGITKVEASGGRVSMPGREINNEFKRNGRFRFADDSEMQFFVRSSNNPYQWNSSWQPIIPGADLDGSVHGRYVQLAVDFYPSANGEASPYLEEISITYLPDEAPLPPAQLTAVAMDGAVQLRWKNSPDQKTQGYLVYYGTNSNDYFGEDAAFGVSPIDAGKQNALYIDGLKNGTLYYFRVAAYSGDISHIGEFSHEVRARPLR